MTNITVCALYKFVLLDDYQTMQAPLYRFLEEHSIRGTLLLAKEGINGTVSGSEQAIEALLNELNHDPRLHPISFKKSYHDEQPFYRTKVKLKKEIVTMGVDSVNPLRSVGTYIEPKDWNQLVSQPDVLLLDTRNDYEVEIGTFKGAVNPNTQTFREFPEYVKHHLEPDQHKKVAMFCTGGIRCEKSTAYLKDMGFEEVYHLKGGILQYLQDVPKEQSLWQGDCFVFDNRVAVNHDLEKSHYDQCYGCRFPITEQDKTSPQFEAGVTCPRCYGTHSDEQLARFREREKQVRLAKARNEEHVGKVARDITTTRRRVKAEQQRERALLAKAASK